MPSVEGTTATGPEARAGVGGWRLAEAGALLVMVAWAANFVIVKDAIATAPPIGFAFVRFLLAGLVLLAILRWREGSASRSLRFRSGRGFPQSVFSPSRR